MRYLFQMNGNEDGCDCRSCGYGSGGNAKTAVKYKHAQSFEAQIVSQCSIRDMVTDHRFKLLHSPFVLSAFHWCDAEARRCALSSRAFTQVLTGERPRMTASQQYVAL